MRIFSQSKKYYKHVKKLYQRPSLNGLDSPIEDRYASPFELFFDLIFVIALSKLAGLVTSENVLDFIKAILLFSTIYTIWFNLSKYTVMYLKNETNYWVRLVIFLVMLPMIYFLSIDDITSANVNFAFYFTLAVTKLILALVFRDSIENSSINHITIGRVYQLMANTMVVVSILLLINGFVHSEYFQIIILSIICYIEVFWQRKRSIKIQQTLKYPMLINYGLFVERQLLFVILVFGESLISILHGVDYANSVLTIFNVFIMFCTMYLFYIRISEEVEHNPVLIKNSVNIFYWLRCNIAIFLIFQMITEISHTSSENHEIIPYHVMVISLVLIYIVVEDIRLNLKNLKRKTYEKEQLFYKTDIKLLILMLIVPILLLIIPLNIIIINILLLIYFTLHILSLPLREHLLKNYKI